MSTSARKPVGIGGLIIVDKPAGWTSHDVVGRLRKLARTRRVGHAGTLDPMATGVLVVGVEKATRLLHHLLLTDKEYIATIRLGQSTVSDDADGELVATAAPGSVAALTQEQVQAAMLTLTGEIQQVPATVSAIKIDGKRAHEMVRDGEDVELAARTVTVTRFDATGWDRPCEDLLDVSVHVECASGTYVRALARDLGERIGVGGHLTTLRRTRVGPFTIAQASTLEELAAMEDPVVLPLAKAIAQAFEVREITDEQALALTYGKRLPPVGMVGTYAVFDPAGNAVALMQDSEIRAQPVLVCHGKG
jgi:tRNA pseudouridine55 synthase